MKEIFQTSFQYITAGGKIQKEDFTSILKSNQFSLLYFYPKNDTPGCTLENINFNTLKESFQKKGIQLIGVSRDSIESHESFRKKYTLGVILISDSELLLHNYFGAYGEKNNYGKKVMGVIRSTFLLSNTGEVLQEWKNVKAKGHAEKVLREIL